MWLALLLSVVPTDIAICHQLNHNSREMCREAALLIKDGQERAAANAKCEADYYRNKALCVTND